MHDTRAEDLEIKVAYLERHLLELDDVVRKLHHTVSTLEHDLRALREAKGPDGDANGESSGESLTFDVPPHY